MRETGEKYYRILDLEPGASPEEIHQGYIDLTWVWHPDRFVGNPRLQHKAQCKLQEINEAHAQLRSLQATPRTHQSPAKSTSHVSPTPQAQSAKDKWYQQQATQTQQNQQQTTQARQNQQQTTQTQEVDEKKTVKDDKSSVSPKKSRSFDEWLD